MLNRQNYQKNELYIRLISIFLKKIKFKTIFSNFLVPLLSNISIISGYNAMDKSSRDTLYIIIKLELYFLLEAYVYAYGCYQKIIHFTKGMMCYTLVIVYYERLYF